MANRHRGETDVRLDGKSYRMCLTLGALAELETVFGDQDMLALASRFENGRLKSSDAMRIIGAGLRGAGYDIDDQAVGAMQCDGGAAGYVSAVAALLEATFGAGQSGSGQTSAGDQASSRSAQVARPEVRAGDPFPGKT